MLKDSFGRRINYLRVSVTDRCNLSCIYCVPRKDFVAIPHESILRFEEIEEIVREGAGLGINKVRITGGEPLVRRDIAKLVEKIAAISGVDDLCLTTNGVLLGKFAASLRKAGLKRVNVSLDAMDPQTYARITGGGDIRQVIEGIESARDAGLCPLKINCVILPSVPEEERDKVRQYCADNGFDLQFISLMDIEDGADLVKKASWAHRPPLCSTCNKIRLTADGRLYPCLFSPRHVLVREEPSASAAIVKAVSLKGERGHCFPHDSMSRIGG